MAETKNVFVVSHTESQHHIDDRVGGWFDADLTPFGERQAAATASALREILKSQHPHVISSDLRRAFRTAEIIASTFGVDAIADERLREISYGQADGRPQSWLDERIVPAPVYGRDHLDHEVVAGAESRRNLIKRVYSAVSDLPHVTDTIIVTHGFALTFVVSSWIGMRPEDAGRVHFAATPGGITQLKFDSIFKSKSVILLNDTSHLDNVT